MRVSDFLRHSVSGLALAAVAAGGAIEAAAQSAAPSKKETKPAVSTRMSDSDASAPSGDASSGSSLMIDFTRPAAAPAAKPAAPEARPEPPKPEAAKPAEAAGLGKPCTTGDGNIDALVLAASSRFGVDPCFVVAVIDAESAGERYAVSSKGACGYMQLMPDTARRFGVTDIFDARQNIFAGTEYLRWLLDRFDGSMELALAGYNAGENAVERYGNCIPPYAETQNYVRKIAGRYLTHRAGLVAVPAAASLEAAAPKPPPAPAPVVHNLVVDFDEKP
jgi:soluble lytic murein transglycosylase-like protein